MDINDNFKRIYSALTMGGLCSSSEILFWMDDEGASIADATWEELAAHMGRCERFHVNYHGDKVKEPYYVSTFAGRRIELNPPSFTNGGIASIIFGPDEQEKQRRREAAYLKEKYGNWL